MFVCVFVCVDGIAGDDVCSVRGVLASFYNLFLLDHVNVRLISHSTVYSSRPKCAPVDNLWVATKRSARARIQ